jgi:hypothetical protein
MKKDLLEREEKLQLEQCSRAWKPVAPCSCKGWDFYGHFNSGLGGLFSSAMDLWAFLDELVCLCLIGGGGTILRAFCSSALWQIYQTLYLLFREQECRFITPSQDAGITVLSMGGWDTHSSALGLQTKHHQRRGMSQDIFDSPMLGWVNIKQFCNNRPLTWQDKYPGL